MNVNETSSFIIETEDRDCLIPSHSTKWHKRRSKDIVKEEVDMFADDFDLNDSMDFGNFTT